MFKKQDESIESLNCDEAEATVSSPTMVQSSPEVTQSDQPLIEASPANTTSEVGAPVEFQSNNFGVCDGGGQSVGLGASEGDIPVEEALNWFIDSPPEPLDYKIFSPLHVQVQSAMGSSSMFYPGNNELSASNTGLQFNNGANETDADTSDFVDSILQQPVEFSHGESSIQNISTIPHESLKSVVFVKDSGSYSGSDVDLATIRIQQEFQGADLLEGNVDQKPSSSLFSVSNAHQQQINLGLLQNEPYEQKSLASISATDQFNNLNKGSSNTNQVGGSDIDWDGIRIRPRNPRRNQQFDRNLNMQGDASRRFLLQSKLQAHFSTKSGDLSSEEVESECIVTKEAKVTEMETPVCGGDNGIDEQHKSSLVEVSESLIDTKNNCSILSKVSSMFSKASCARNSFWPNTMFRVAVFAVLFAVVVSRWRHFILNTA